MNRHLLFRVTIPSVIIGILFFSGCLVSIGYIQRLHTNLAEVLSENVTSLQAAQELEICVRQLRFHTFLYLLDPKVERLQPIEEDQGHFKHAMEVARQASTTPEELDMVRTIEAAFERYKKEQDRLRTFTHGQPLPELYKVADSHLVRRVVDPCQELLRLNKDKLDGIAVESQRVSHEGYLAMLFMGLAGPIGGLVVGFGLTRGLRQSIYRLSVRVQDLAQHLDRDVGSVSVVADGDLHALEEQMKYIVQKVEQAAKQLQQQQRELLRTEQLSQVGQLAAGVAHEIRNPLTGIKLLVEAALRPQAPRPLTQADTQLIFREVKRLEQTVEQFLNFARLPAPQTAPCDLREIIQGAWALVQVRASQQQVVPDFHLPAEPIIVAVDAGQLSSVLVNLFLNALDATGNGGRLEVYLAPTEQGTIQLRICDTGPGFSPDIQERLFQPFATSKPHGTGLGLFLTGRILEEHGGSISAVNRPEGGACLTITLPMNQAEHSARQGVKR